MERALHSELAKRMVSTDAMTGRSLLSQMSAMTLVQRTREGIGKKIPQDRRLKDVTILDRFNNATVVKVVASDWIDYLEVAKFNGEWKIINVLWELKPK
jgi:Putative lumazine-binding